MDPSRPGKRVVRGDVRLGVVRALPSQDDDVSLVEALLAGQRDAAARLYDRHVGLVHRFVFRLLGPVADIEDIVQEVFAYALSSIAKLRDPAALQSWLLGIAVGKVRAYIRWRRRKRWLAFLPTDELPEPGVVRDDEHAEVLREVTAILDRLPVDERIALVVHRVQGMSLSESAAACKTSVSTFKRRLAKGEAKFFARAEKRPALATWLEGSSHHDAE
jgi:RNA polymerase sigma-70 factor (ECF subfamily)